MQQHAACHAVALQIDMHQAEQSNVFQEPPLHEDCGYCEMLMARHAPLWQAAALGSSDQEAGLADCVTADKVLFSGLVQRQ